MNILDIVLLIPLGFGFIQGIRHGFVKEIGAFVAIVIGIYLARYWAPDFSKIIVGWFDTSARIALITAYAVIFILGTLGIHLLAYILSKLLDVIKVGWVNKIIGAAFGTFKWLLILSLCLNFIGMINNFAPIIEKKAVKESVLYKPVENVMNNVIPFLNFDKFKEFTQNISK